RPRWGNGRRGGRGRHGWRGPRVSWCGVSLSHPASSCWSSSSLPPPRCAEAEAAPQLPRAREEEADLRLVRPSYCSTPVLGGTYPAFPGYGATCGFPGLSGARLLLPLPPLVDRRAHLLGCPTHGLRVAGDLLERGQEVSEPVRRRSAGRRVEPDGVGVPRLHAADGGGAFADDVGLDEFVEVGGDGFALGEAEDDGEQVE